MKYSKTHTVCCFVVLAGFLVASPVRAAFTAPYALTPVNWPASYGAWTAASYGMIGGYANISSAPDQLQLSTFAGSWDGSGIVFTTIAAESGTVSFAATSVSLPGGGCIIWFCERNGSTVEFEYLDQIPGVPGTPIPCAFPVQAGDKFGFYVTSGSDSLPPGSPPWITLTVSNFTAPGMLPVIPMPSPIQLKNPILLPGGAFQFTFSNTPSTSMTVLASTNAEVPLANWSELSGIIETTSGHYQFTDPDATNFTQRFYLLRIP
jgi:hypothetical protein